MRKFALTFIFALPCTFYGQTMPVVSNSLTSNEAVSSSSSDSPGSSIPNPSAATSKPADYPREAQVGSVSESFVYAEVPGLYGANRSLVGFAVTPEINLMSKVGLQADFETMSVRGILYPDQSRIILAAGPRVSFAPLLHVNPFVYAEAGEMRLSIEYAPIDWNPVVKGGFGFDYKVAKHFSLQLIPGEYLGQYQDNGRWLNGFSSRVGIKFSLVRSRYPSV
jgi:hypothetical protein